MAIPQFLQAAYNAVTGNGVQSRVSAGAPTRVVSPASGSNAKAPIQVWPVGTVTNGGGGATVAGVGSSGGGSTAVAGVGSSGGYNPTAPIQVQPVGVGFSGGNSGPNTAPGETYVYNPTQYGPQPSASPYQQSSLGAGAVPLPAYDPNESLNQALIAAGYGPVQAAQIEQNDLNTPGYGFQPGQYQTITNPLDDSALAGYGENSGGQLYGQQAQAAGESLVQFLSGLMSPSQANQATPSQVNSGDNGY